MKRLLALCLLLLSSTTAFAANPQKAAYPSGNETVAGLLYLPSGAGPHPAIVLIHEWWGLNDWIKEQAAGYAAQGYVALAVDLYRGQTASDPDTAHQLSRGLPEDRAVRDMTSAVRYLASRKDVDAKRIGAVGWCMGGGYALQLAIAEPALRAVAINYGALATDPESIARIHASLLGNFGGQDRGIPPSDVTAFEKAMKAAGKQADIKIYPQAGHAFENPNNKSGYRAGDAEDAQQRMRRFFAQQLQK